MLSVRLPGCPCLHAFICHVCVCLCVSVCLNVLVCLCCLCACVLVCVHSLCRRDNQGTGTISNRAFDSVLKRFGVDLTDDQFSRLSRRWLAPRTARSVLYRKFVEKIALGGTGDTRRVASAPSSRSSERVRQLLLSLRPQVRERGGGGGVTVLRGSDHAWLLFSLAVLGLSCFVAAFTHAQHAHAQHTYTYTHVRTNTHTHTHTQTHAHTSTHALTHSLCAACLTPCCGTMWIFRLSHTLRRFAEACAHLGLHMSCAPCRCSFVFWMTLISTSQRFADQLCLLGCSPLQATVVRRFAHSLCLFLKKTHLVFVPTHIQEEKETLLDAFGNPNRPVVAYTEFLTATLT